MSSTPSISRPAAPHSVLRRHAAHQRSTNSPGELKPLVRLLLVGLSCTLGGTSLNALAQSGAAADANDTSGATLPAVEVKAGLVPDGLINFDAPSSSSNRLGLTARETPASVSVIDRGTIESRGDRNTHDMLRNAMGLTFTSTAGDTDVSYRGFHYAAVTQLFNGINLQYVIADRPVDSWIYDRVEVLGGASSFLYGAGGVGGTINYVTKTAQKKDITEARIGLGSYGLKTFSAGLNRQVAGDDSGQNDHYLRVDLNHRRGGDWSDGTDSHSTQLATSVLSQLGNGFNHTLAYEFQDEHIDRPYWATPVLTPAEGRLNIDESIRTRNYNAANGLYEQRVNWLRSVSNWTLNDAVTLRNTLYYYDARRDFHNVEIHEFVDDNTRISRSGALQQRHSQRQIGNRFDAVIRSTLGGLKSDWVVGLDISHARQYQGPQEPALDDGVVSITDPHAFVPDDFYAIPGMTPGYVRTQRNLIKNAALYAENSTALTPAVKLLSSLRYEHLRLESLDLTGEATGPNPASRTYHPVTGRLGVSWDLTPAATVYAQFSTAASPASGVLATANSRALSNNTRLTKGRQLEVGTKLSFWNNKGSATVALYDIHEKNLSTTDPSDPRRVLLVGAQESRGAEFQLGLNPTARWSIQGNLSFVRPRYRDYWEDGVSFAGNTPVNTPRTVLGLWSAYAFTPAFRGDIALRHVGKAYGNSANTTWWPAYTTVDVGLDYRINRRISLSGRVYNATNRIYAEYVADTNVVLAKPRTAEIALKYSF